MENTLLNLIPAAYLPEVHISQYDIGRTLTFNLKEGASDYNVPTGATVTVKATKPSGFGFAVPCTFSGGVVTLVVTETMTPEHGRFPAELSIVSGNTTIGTSNFIFNIERSPHPEGTIDGDAESLLPELTLLVERVESAASSVLDMQVVANTLPAGSQATYSYDEELNKATFGIPQGEPGSGAVGTVASAYDASKTYAVGDYAIHNNDLYRCITAITTAEAFTASHWTKIVLTDDVGGLKSALGETQYNLGYFARLTIHDGYLKDNGTFASTSSYKTKLTDYIPCNEGDVFYYTGTKSNIAVSALFYNESFAIVGSSHDLTIVTPSGAKYVRFASFGANGSQITLKVTSKDGDFNKLIADINANQSVNSMEGRDVLDNISWVVGGINTSGADMSSATRIRTADYIKINNNIANGVLPDICCNTENGYGIALYYYNASKVHIVTDSYNTFKEGEYIHTPPTNATYIRLALRKNDDSTADVSWGSKVKCSCVSNTVIAVKELQHYGESGNNIYYGENINLSITDKTHKCDIEPWLIVNGDTIPNYQSYNFYKAQAITMINDYVFLFFAEGTGVILSYSTKEMITPFSFTPSVTHANNAQFSDIYYDVNDEFPLLFLSRCGNNNNITNADECIIYRITRDGTDFTFTQINTIRANHRVWQNSWAINNESSLITEVAYLNGQYDVTVNNPEIFTTWKMPSKEAILSGNEITLDVDECISVYNSIVHELLQGIIWYNGLIYHVRENYLDVLDVMNGRIVSRLPEIDTSEFEGVCILNGKMYTMHRYGVNASANNPVRIYEVTF